jgi:ABC-type phosphate transport system substrate-binding protein
LPLLAVALLSLFAVDVAPTSDEAYLLIVNGANPGTSIQREAAAAIFLGQMTRWKSDNRLISPVDQSTRTAVRAAFSERILRKPVMAVQFFWGQQLASGRGIPPPVKGSDDEVAAFVRANPSAIGYVSSGFAIGEGVKALKVVD